MSTSVLHDTPTDMLCLRFKMNHFRDFASFRFTSLSSRTHHRAITLNALTLNTGFPVVAEWEEDRGDQERD
jgi:hypothetical protein